MPPYAPQDGNGSGAGYEFRITVAVILAALGVWMLGPEVQTPIASVLRGTVLRPFLAMQLALDEAQIRAEEASVFQARIDTLTAEAMSRTTLEEENRRLRGLLHLGTRLGPRWRAVQILRTGGDDRESTLHVEAGENQGIQAGAALLTREGLAGIIDEAAPNWSVGYDWTHTDFRASGMTLDGLNYGIVQSETEAPFRRTRLVFKDLRYSAEVDSGTVVVTSGLGDFPRGIPIGRVVARVSSAADSIGGWHKSFWLEPFVEAGSVTLALVEIQDAAPQEDLSGAWTLEGFFTAAERMNRGATLEDSLRILRDSLARLEGIIGERPPGGS